MPSARVAMVVHTLEAALWSVDRAADFREAVLLAANLADDADTVAAVTGADRRGAVGEERDPATLAGPARLARGHREQGATASRGKQARHFSGAGWGRSHSVTINSSFVRV